MSNKGKHFLSAAILAGGEASRLNGLVKGKIVLPCGQTIIEHLLSELALVSLREVIIVANDANHYVNYGRKVIPDLQKGLGPLAGIASALTYYANIHQATLFLPCDLPYISALEINALKNFYCNSDVPIVHAKTRIAHPLCAIVSNSLLGAICASIDCGERNVSAVWRKLGCAALAFADEKPWVNINTPTDLNALQ